MYGSVLGELASVLVALLYTLDIRVLAGICGIAGPFAVLLFIAEQVLLIKAYIRASSE